MSYLLVQGLQSMTLDERRNQAYKAALARVIRPESVVLDLGAGLGVHGLLAAQMGAKQVYLVEPEDIISVAGKTAIANGFGDRVQCFQGKIEDVELPEKVDVIVSVFTGNFLLEEDLLPSLFYARDRYLKKGGVMIPDAGVMEAAPVFLPELYSEQIECWSKPHMGIDYTAARTYASQSVYYYREELSKGKYLAPAAELLTLDFHQANSTYLNTQVKYAIAESGLCHGVVGWFKMRLGDMWLSTAPHEPPLHWSAGYLPFDPAIEVKLGEEINFKLQRPPKGDWTWQVITNTTKQIRSTFFSVPKTLKTLKKASWDYQPQIDSRGEAAVFILSHCDGNLTIQDLGNKVIAEYPHLFTSLEEAIVFVQNLIYQFS